MPVDINKNNVPFEPTDASRSDPDKLAAYYFAFAESLRHTCFSPEPVYNGEKSIGDKPGIKESYLNTLREL